MSLSAPLIPLNQIIGAFILRFDGSREHLIIQTVRLPRSIIAIIVGAAMATAGAIMQGVTRNPLADPGILGVNAGAACAVVLGILAFGAGVTVVSVYLLASLGRSGVTPLNLTIAGAAVSSTNRTSLWNYHCCHWGALLCLFISAKS